MDITSFPPKAIKVAKSDVESFAEEFATQVNFQPGEDIEHLIRRLGGNLVVGSSGHGDTESGSIVVRSLSDFTIYISQHTSTKRDRFTIAHELGHLLLHYSAHRDRHPGTIMRATRYVDVEDPEQQRAEWEANWFAASFLMPSESFREAYREHPEQLSNKFGVSQSAVDIRAKRLGLV